MGALVAYAGVQGAVYNVKINLMSIKDQDFKDQMRSELGKLLADSKAVAEEVDRLVLEEIDK